MKAIGIMSGTSLDGIDLCLMEYQNDQYSLLAFNSYPYEIALVKKIKDASKIISSNVQQICSLNYEVAYAYVDAIKKFIKTYQIDLNEVTYIAMHGQTIWHNPNEMDGYYSSTLQIGEPAVLAYEFNKMVISNFRTMDMAAGGLGAPLIPFINYILYHKQHKNIAFQNIGGIGNVCYLKQDATLNDIIAFDTGPGNMLIDGAMQKLYQKPYDENGQIAKSGKIDYEVLELLLNDEYLTKPYPKATGREKYNDQYLDQIIKMLCDHHAQKEDMIATITAYTAYTIIKEYQMFLGKIDEVIVSGGGAHNEFIIDLLRKNLKAKITIMENTDGFEAFGFAILGHMTLQNKPSNVPSVTGAKEPVILGNITNPPRGNKQYE